MRETVKKSFDLNVSSREGVSLILPRGYYTQKMVGCRLIAVELIVTKPHQYESKK